MNVRLKKWSLMLKMVGDAVSMVQLVGGLVISENRKEITKEDVLWMIQASRLTPKLTRNIKKTIKSVLFVV